MALLKTLKRAFGFGPDEIDDDESEGIDARVTQLQRRPADTSLSTGSDDAPANVADMRGEGCINGDADEKSAIVPAAIFETVVKIFNESLPEFIRESVDEKTQREYIYSALDASMHEYLEKLAVDARTRCEVKWENERRNLMAQLDEMRRQSQKREEDSNDSRKLQLSAERQKRALGERVHDLERQLEEAQAENEQYVLENKSLINKIRLSAVMGGGDVANADEQLVAKLTELTEQHAASQAENQSLKDAAAEINEQLAALTADNGNLRSEIESRDTEITRLRDALEQSRVKDNLGDAMLTDLNAKLAASMECEREQARELADNKAELENLRSELENIRQEYSNLKIKHEATAGELAEAIENLAVVDQLRIQLNTLEAARHANEAFLRKQKDDIMQKEEKLRELELEKNECAEALRQKDDALRALEDVTDNLRKTIETNLYEHAQTESALRFEIERLKATCAAPEVEPAVVQADEPTAVYASVAHDFEIVTDSPAPAAARPKKAKGARKSKLKISAIDETLEDTDWLISTPPPAKNKKETDDNEKVDFGYREPARKTAPDNPAQMSLW